MNLALEQLTIPKRDSRGQAFDAEALFLAGTDYIRQYAGQIWTDYNVHDPGITTLELLCYAITDLSYRTTLPVADLLASVENEETDQSTGIGGSLHRAPAILPNKPLTENDYRRLLIDIPEINNAWITPASTSLYADLEKSHLLADPPANRKFEEIKLKGIFNAKLDYTNGLSSSEKDAAREKARTVLMANRNLCQDWADINDVVKQNFFICGDIELSPNAQPEPIYAEILNAVEKYLAPVIPRYNLNEMLARKNINGEPYTASDIFEGPLLENGFIDDADLLAAELRTEIRLSDIIGLVMDIEGVERLREFHISQTGISTNNQGESKQWLLPVKQGRKPALSIKHSHLNFFSNHVPLVLSTPNTILFLNALRDKEQQILGLKRTQDFTPSVGRFRSSGQYHSFQNHFPAVYGLSDFGPSSGATEADKNKTFQLKAFLLFIDQLLANYLSQLSNIGKLFSTNPEHSNTYWVQVVDTFKDWEHIYSYGNSETLSDPADPDLSKEELTELRKEYLSDLLEEKLTDTEQSLDRRNRFLDHLIARFSEQFSSYSNALIDAFDSRASLLARYKCNFFKPVSNN